MPDIPFHTQDKFLYCGVACAQMLLNWHSNNLGDPAVFVSDQDDIYGGTQAEPNRTPTGEARSSVSFTGPYQLSRWLNKVWKARTAGATQPAGWWIPLIPFLRRPWKTLEKQFPGDEDTTRADIEARDALIADLRAVAANNLPSCVMSGSRSHWVVIKGVKEQAGEEIWYWLNPWLEGIYEDNSAPHAGFVHQPLRGCPCGSWRVFIIVEEAGVGLSSRMVFWPRQRNERPAANFQNLVDMAMIKVFQDSHDHTKAFYAVVPNGKLSLLPEAGGSAKRKAGHHERKPLSLQEQLQNAGLSGAAAGAPWSEAGSEADAFESREVKCVGEPKLSYTLHFRECAGDWLAAVTDADGWLFTAAVIRGNRPSLLKAENAAVASVQAAKSVKLADGRTVVPAQYQVTADAGLLWIPCAQSAVPYLPMVRVRIADRASGAELGAVYVTITGGIHSTLSREGRKPKQP